MKHTREGGAGGGRGGGDALAVSSGGAVGGGGGGGGVGDGGGTATWRRFKRSSGWMQHRRVALWNGSAAEEEVTAASWRSKRRTTAGGAWRRQRNTRRWLVMAMLMAAIVTLWCGGTVVSNMSNNAVYTNGCTAHAMNASSAPPSRVISESKLLSAQVNHSLSVAQLMVLTHGRAGSLQRLLQSLQGARYKSHAAHLHIWIDRSKPSGKWWWLQAMVWRLGVGGGGLNREVVDTASKFVWTHGDKQVHAWTRHVGIWGQWLECYRPRAQAQEDDREVAVILEDDLEVSAAFFEWLLLARRAYGRRGDIFGYTLQRGELRANQTGFGRRKLSIGEEEGAYLYPLIGSWGYSPVGSKWAAFRRWFHEKQCERDFKPYVEGLVPTRWYKKQEKARSMWTMWHIYYANERGWKTVYANVGGGRTLAASWREKGLHFGRGGGRRRRGGAGGVTGERDAEVAGRNGEPVRFRLPAVPLELGWNGTYVRRDGRRARAARRRVWRDGAFRGA